MNKKKFPEGFFTKDRPIAKPKFIDADGLREYWLTNGKTREYTTQTISLIRLIISQPKMFSQLFMRIGKT